MVSTARIFYNSIINTLFQQMDFEAISFSPESVLEELGLKEADVYALNALFSRLCETRKKSDQDRRKRRLVQEIVNGTENKAQNRKALKKKHDLSVRAKTRNISIGWMHYNDIKGKYVIVRAKRGGTRSLEVKLNISKEELIEEGKACCFFKMGHRLKEGLITWGLDWLTLKREIIGDLKDKNGKDVPFIVQGYFDMYKHSKAFIYLSGKCVPFTDSDDETELEKSPFDDYSPSDKGRPWRRNLNLEFDRETDKRDAISLIRTSEERQVLAEEQNKAYQQSLEADQSSGQTTRTKNR